MCEPRLDSDSNKTTMRQVRKLGHRVGIKIIYWIPSNFC